MRERLKLAQLPTPLHELPALSQRLGLRVRVKRDDLTGSHLSGNKVRKLEFLLGQAVAREATHVLTTGGVQSNHCRATALAAVPLGLRPVLLLRTPNGDPGDLPQPPAGNVLLDRLAGARLVPCTPAAYEQRDALLAELAEELRAAGGRPYVIPEGGSNALGAYGYVEAARELALQWGDDAPDTVVVATGSGGTLAGLAMGFKTLGLPTRPVGVPVTGDAATFRRRVLSIGTQAHATLGLPALAPEDFGLLDGYVGRGYALSTPAELSLLRDTARRDGLVLDPVYTNKAMAALVDQAPRPARPLGEDIVFLHTGGIFGLMAAGAELAAVC